LGFIEYLCRILKSFLISEPDYRGLEYWSEQNVLAQARRDWIAALSLFEEATGLEMTDFAIYNLQAAEKRYNYLLKRQRPAKDHTNQDLFEHSNSA
jgi:hypothetical protein